MAQRVRTVLDGPLFNAIVSREQFSLQAFERLLADLPGDDRERLQEAFAGNLISASLIGVAPRDVLRGYQGGRSAGVVEQWIDDPSKTHLLCSPAAALCHHLDHMRHHDGDQVRQVRDSRGARLGLGQFLAQLARAPAGDPYAEHRPDGVIYFTDGYGPYPHEDPGIKTLWILSKPHDFRCPWGQRACLDKTHEPDAVD